MLYVDYWKRFVLLSFTNNFEILNLKKIPFEIKLFATILHKNKLKKTFFSFWFENKHMYYGLRPWKVWYEKAKQIFCFS